MSQAFIQSPDQITLNVIKNMVGDDYMKYIGKPVVLEENAFKQQNNIVLSEDDDENEENKSIKDGENDYNNAKEIIDRSNKASNTNSNKLKQNDNNNDDDEEYDEDFVDINDYSK